MLAEHLEDRDAARHELEHVVALEFSSRGDRSEDRADVGQAAAADLRGVRHRLQDLGELSALLDAGGREAGRDGGGVAQSERGALDGCERVVHDLGDACAVVAEALELGLRVLDVEGAREAAFGGQCGDASGDGGDRACADLADLAERAADLRDEGVGAFPRGFADGVADVAFDAFAESFAGWFDVDVYDADVLCCHRVPCCLSGFRWRSGSEIVVDVEVGFEPFPVLALPTGEAVRRCRLAEGIVPVVEPWSFLLLRSGQPCGLFGSVGHVDGVLQCHPRVARVVFENLAGQCPCESPVGSRAGSREPFLEAYGPVDLPVRSDPVVG